MIISKLEGVKIASVATAVPKQYYAVDSYKELLGDAAIEKFKKATGIHGRYISSDKQTASDLAYAAAERILATQNLSSQEVQAIVFVTQCPDYVKPATAYVLQHRLGCAENCIALDINLGCSGFVYGVYVLASLMITSPNIKNALLLLGDTEGKERLLNTAPQDITLNTLLFGDCGAAVLLQKDQEAAPLSCAFRSDGSGFRNIIDPVGWRHLSQLHHKTYMDGMGVFSFAINEAPRLIKDFMEQAGKTPENYDCLALHQSNLSIMKQIIRRSGFTGPKAPVSLDEYANTSVTSVLNAIVKKYSSLQCNTRPNILACCYGVGLSWGVLSFTIDTADILPLIRTDKIFDDELSSNIL